MSSSENQTVYFRGSDGTMEAQRVKVVLPNKIPNYTVKHGNIPWSPEVESHAVSQYHNRGIVIQPTKDESTSKPTVTHLLSKDENIRDLSLTYNELFRLLEEELAKISGTNLIQFRKLLDKLYNETVARQSEQLKLEKKTDNLSTRLANVMPLMPELTSNKPTQIPVQRSGITSPSRGVILNLPSSSFPNPVVPLINKGNVPTTAPIMANNPFQENNKPLSLIPPLQPESISNITLKQGPIITPSAPSKPIDLEKILEKQVKVVDKIEPITVQQSVPIPISTVNTEKSEESNVVNGNNSEDDDSKNTMDTKESPSDSSVQTSPDKKDTTTHGYWNSSKLDLNQHTNTPVVPNEETVVVTTPTPLPILPILVPTDKLKLDGEPIYLDKEEEKVSAPSIPTSSSPELVFPTPSDWKDPGSIKSPITILRTISSTTNVVQPVLGLGLPSTNGSQISGSPICSIVPIQPIVPLKSSPVSIRPIGGIISPSRVFPTPPGWKDESRTTPLTSQTSEKTGSIISPRLLHKLTPVMPIPIATTPVSNKDGGKRIPLSENSGNKGKILPIGSFTPIK